jgi:hypothetical protein
VTGSAQAQYYGERVATVEVRIDTIEKRVDELKSDIGSVRNIALGILVASLSGLAGILFQLLTGSAKH